MNYLMLNIPSIKILLSKKFIKSFVYGFLNKKVFSNINFFCFFIGYPRSGHTLVAALLDAHPEVCMSMEVHALKLVEEGYSRNQIFYIILNNSREVNKRLKNVWKGYSYSVPNQYQGNFTSLKIIGDKKGGRSTSLFSKDFSIYSRLFSNIKCPIKILHVIRNPFDNISTMIIRSKLNKFALSKEDFLSVINQYFKLVEINSKIRNHAGFDIFELYHEDIINNPVSLLKDLLNFFELQYSNDYLKDCTSIIYHEPHRSRCDIEWPQELIDVVQSNISQYFFLKRYSFQDGMENKSSK